MRIPVRGLTEEHRIQMILLMGCRVAIEIIHKVLSLHALIATITYLGREELDDSREGRYHEKGTYPRVVYLCLGCHRVSDIGHKQVHTVMCCDQRNRVTERWCLEDSNLQVSIHASACFDRDRDREAPSFVFTEEHVCVFTSGGSVGFKEV